MASDLIFAFFSRNYFSAFVPHLVQKRLPSVNTAPQDVQKFTADAFFCSTDVPHLLQNKLPAGNAAPQLPQRMLLLLTVLEETAAVLLTVLLLALPGFFVKAPIA